MSDKEQIVIQAASPSSRQFTWFNIAIAFLGVCVSVGGILGTYFANLTAHEDRIFIEIEARKERANIRRAEEKNELLAARIKAVTDLQQAYGNFQDARFSFIADYINFVSAIGRYSIGIKIGEKESIDIDKENAALAQSAGRVLAAVMSYRKEFIGCSIVFEFNEPNIEFLAEALKVDLRSMTIDDIAIVEKELTPLYKKAAKYADRHDGKFYPEFVPDMMTAIFALQVEIRNRMMKQDLEIEKIYSDYFKKCWASINSMKETSK